MIKLPIFNFRVVLTGHLLLLHYVQSTSTYNLGLTIKNKNIFTEEEEQPLGKLEFTHHIYEEYQPILPRESKPPIILQSVPYYSVSNFFTLNKPHQAFPYPEVTSSSSTALSSDASVRQESFHHQHVILVNFWHICVQSYLETNTLWWLQFLNVPRGLCTL